ncbi:hypothetical protein [Streptomyces sp. NPDC053069]|uniref:hypothetical protein n=1 Tax=Streptomyces sp. NPDC053069 TaxID=3365695 RepID=UPI0037D61981
MASMLSASIALTGTNVDSAAPSVSKEREVIVVTPMKVVGFDAAVAEEHGYKIVTLPNGEQTSVPKGGRVVPNTTVHGDCGDSYLHFHAVVRYGWSVDVTDRFGVGRLHDSGWATGPNHEMHFLTHSGGAGDAHAQVEDGSYTILIDGEECHSGSPWDSTYYFKD